MRCAEIKCPKGKEPIACTATNTGNDCQACPTGTFADTETFRKRREDVFGNCEMKTCQTMRSCTGDDIEVLQYGNATENTKCKCTKANHKFNEESEECYHNDENSKDSKKSLIVIVAVCTSIAVFIILIVLGLYGYYRVKRRDNNRRDDGCFSWYKSRISQCIPRRNDRSNINDGNRANNQQQPLDDEEHGVVIPTRG
ncbi:DgyrCDS10774 [Dimorphilus gyrociliatus]|uniref:DgyrCDS10774 n=1 Tax=Dimorphilus gyrociliatus TaxID=2664684 RepID=A0A7I8W2B2_9ANNE|nr:DgyrCDS10774 [Dimorphilus gyrociliatus]